jgi:hypothetical protein
MPIGSVETEITTDGLHTILTELGVDLIVFDGSIRHDARIRIKRRPFDEYRETMWRILDLGTDVDSVETVTEVIQRT